MGKKQKTADKKNVFMLGLSPEMVAKLGLNGELQKTNYSVNGFIFVWFANNHQSSVVVKQQTATSFFMDIIERCFMQLNFFKGTIHIEIN